ncbi:MAG TPA: hypothetical protein VMF04_06520 [Thermoplasmata archaeon]|nr:hypothetical protein [Thermoplasmata archaeon]
MATHLRISLTILSMGFAVEGIAELYSLTTAGALLPGTSWLFLLPALITVLGLLFILVGKHEWDEVHRNRVHRANTVFVASLVAGVVAILELGALALYPAFGTPWWAELLFGGAAAGFVLGTFVTYSLLVFHLVHTPSKGALVAAMAWALLVSAFIGVTLAADLPSILGLIRARSLSFESLFGPIDYLVSFLFLSYFLLLAAYVDAHVTVARGLPRKTRPRGPPGEGPARAQTSNIAR